MRLVRGQHSIRRAEHRFIVRQAGGVARRRDLHQLVIVNISVAVIGIKPTEGARPVRRRDFRLPNGSAPVGGTGVRGCTIELEGHAIRTGKLRKHAITQPRLVDRDGQRLARVGHSNGGTCVDEIHRTNHRVVLVKHIFLYRVVIDFSSAGIVRQIREGIVPVGAVHRLRLPGLYWLRFPVLPAVQIVGDGSRANSRRIIVPGLGYLNLMGVECIGNHAGFGRCRSGQTCEYKRFRKVHGVTRRGYGLLDLVLERHTTTNAIGIGNQFIPRNVVTVTRLRNIDRNPTLTFGDNRTILIDCRPVRAVGGTQQSQLNRSGAGVAFQIVVTGPVLGDHDLIVLKRIGQRQVRRGVAVRNRSMHRIRCLLLLIAEDIVVDLNDPVLDLLAVAVNGQTCPRDLPSVCAVRGFVKRSAQRFPGRLILIHIPPLQLEGDIGRTMRFFVASCVLVCPGLLCGKLTHDFRVAQIEVRFELEVTRCICLMIIIISIVAPGNLIGFGCSICGITIGNRFLHPVNVWLTCCVVAVQSGERAGPGAAVLFPLPCGRNNYFCSLAACNLAVQLDGQIRREKMECMFAVNIVVQISLIPCLAHRHGQLAHGVGEGHFCRAACVILAIHGCYLAAGFTADNLILFNLIGRGKVRIGDGCAGFGDGVGVPLSVCSRAGIGRERAEGILIITFRRRQGNGIELIKCCVRHLVHRTSQLEAGCHACRRGTLPHLFHADGDGLELVLDACGEGVRVIRYVCLIVIILRKNRFCCTCLCCTWDNAVSQYRILFNNAIRNRNTSA